MISLFQRRNILVYAHISFSFLWEGTTSFQIHNNKILHVNHNIRPADSFLQSTHFSSSESRSFPKKSKTTTRRRSSYTKTPERRGELSRRSKFSLSSFEQFCLREGKRLRKSDFVGVLDSMVQDFLAGNIQQNYDSSRLKDASINTKMRNLSLQILPRDASSLIRLLGRHGALDSMLQFCRQYCKDISDIAEQSSGDNVFGESEAEEAILYAYTAAIAACSKPTSASLPTREEKSWENDSNYRSIEFLLSLLHEMEHGYFCGKHLVRPNSYTLTAVLLGVDGGLDALKVLDRFEKDYGNDGGARTVDDNDGIVTVQVYNAAISACSRSKNNSAEKRVSRIDGWQVALSILQRMRRYGPSPNDQTYANILQACAESGQINVALSLLKELQKSSFPLTSKIYLPLLKACANTRNVNVAQSLIESMKENSLRITIEHMNSYLSVVAKCKESARALEILNEMFDSKVGDQAIVPNLITLNTVLSACANSDDFESARDLLEQIKEGRFKVAARGGTNSRKSREDVIRPDIVSYNTVISCADPQMALELIHEMRLSRRNRDGVVLPNSVSFTNAINRCRVFINKSQSIDERDAVLDIALTLLELAGDDNVNVYVYSAAIWTAEAVGNYQVACSLLCGMKNCTPNNVCYDGVISSLAQHGLHREALYIYYEMKKKGLSATRKTYQKVAFAVRNSRESELFESLTRQAALLEGVLSGMSDRDKEVAIGGPLFESLLAVYGEILSSSNGGSGMHEKQRAFRAARMTFDSIVGSVDDACLTAMLAVCSAASPSNWNEAVTLLHSSDIICGEARGPGKVTKRALSNAVIACAKANEWGEGLNLIELYGNCSVASKSNGVVSITAMNLLIRACGRSSRPDKAVEILNNMSVKYSVKPDLASYRYAIVACNHAEHRESIRRRSGTIPEYESSLKWWQCALSLLRRMREEGLQPDAQILSSVVSACEAAGEWQRAIGVLQSLRSFSSFLGGKPTNCEDDPNLYCLNAAISACTKGGAWLEAVQLYEHTRTSSAVRPNFVTVIFSLLLSIMPIKSNSGRQFSRKPFEKRSFPLGSSVLTKWKGEKNAC